MHKPVCAYIVLFAVLFGCAGKTDNPLQIPEAVSRIEIQSENYHQPETQRQSIKDPDAIRRIGSRLMQAEVRRVGSKAASAVQDGRFITLTFYRNGQRVYSLELYDRFFEHNGRYYRFERVPDLD